MMTKIMVAEDNTVDYSCYQSYFSKDKTISFVGLAQDGETAINMYKEKNPDIHSFEGNRAVDAVDCGLIVGILMNTDGPLDPCQRVP